MDSDAVEPAQCEFVSGKILTLCQEADDDVPGFLTELAVGFSKPRKSEIIKGEILQANMAQLGTLLCTAAEKGL